MTCACKKNGSWPSLFYTWYRYFNCNAASAVCSFFLFIFLRICKRCEWQNNIVSASLFNYLVCWKKCKFIFPFSISNYICFNCKIYLSREPHRIICTLQLPRTGEKRGEMCKSFKTLETHVKTLAA